MKKCEKADSFKNLITEIGYLTDFEKGKQSIRFFKTAPGEYSDFDKFRGIPVPVLRKIAKQYENINFIDLKKLMKSGFNEDRLLGLLILVNQFNRGDKAFQEKIYDFYNKNRKYINNWNLVDTSAHWIIGAYLFDKKKELLINFSQSENLWERRIAIVSTWYFIKNNEYTWTLKIAKLLLKDEHDLIHKAVGWMLREIGKREEHVLEAFLDKYARQMPRTMLRYAIEKFTLEKRLFYLKNSIGKH